MKLILVRHAEAVELLQADTELDFARELTQKGHKQAERLAEALRRHELNPGVVATSPLVRAKQTAKALERLLPSGQRFVELQELKLDQFQPHRLARAILGLNHDTVIVVGHMPDLGLFAAWLLGAGCPMVHFKKAAAACFQTSDDRLEEGCGSLEWFVTPKWCQLANLPTSL